MLLRVHVLHLASIDQPDGHEGIILFPGQQYLCAIELHMHDTVGHAAQSSPIVTSAVAG